MLRLLRLLSIVPVWGLLLSLRSAFRNSGSTSTAHRFEAAASAAAICTFRPIVLGDVAAPLARMETCIDPRPTGDGRSLAPCRVQAVLDVALAAPASRGKKTRQQGIAQAAFSHGRR